MQSTSSQRVTDTRSRAALLILLFGAASACRVERPDHPLVRAYLGAEPVTPTWNPDITPAEPMWSQNMELAGVSVTATARCCVGQRFLAQYSDETTARIMFSPGDYIYPRELRLAARERIVYGRASGLADGTTKTTKIFAFDLANRRLLDSVEVDPSLLPQVLEPTTPRPSR